MRYLDNQHFHFVPIQSMLAIMSIFGFGMLTGCENKQQSEYNFETYNPESSPKPKSDEAPTSLNAKRLAFVEGGNWKTQVLQAREPVVVDFWASWCPHCRAMGPIMESLAKDHKAYRVDIDSNPELASMYRVSSVPRLLIFNDGKMVYEHVGIPSEAVVRAELQKLNRR